MVLIFVDYLLAILLFLQLRKGELTKDELCISCLEINFFLTFESIVIFFWHTHSLLLLFLLKDPH